MNIITGFVKKENYVKFMWEGKSSYKHSLTTVSNIATFCKIEKFNNILVLKNITGNLTVLEMFRFCKMMPELFISKKVALVDLKPNDYEINKFGENVFRNRAGCGKLFYNEIEAINWL